MEQIRVILNGAGDIACQLVRHFAGSGRVRIVGAADISPEKIGRDLGDLAGIGACGVTVADSLDAACDAAPADLAVNVASSAEADRTFRQMLPAVARGLDVIVANSATFDLFAGEEALAEEIDALCRARGCTYTGLGNTQSIERLLLLLTESAACIEQLRFTHWADVHAFSARSNANQLGISLTKAEYAARLREGRAAPLVKWRRDLLLAVAARLHFDLDRVDYDRELLTGADGIIHGNVSRLRGWVGGRDVIHMDWVFLLDEERRYYDRIVLEGSPSMDCTVNFSPDRGKVATYACIANAIPAVVGAPPGYLSSFALPICAYLGPSQLGR